MCSSICSDADDELASAIQTSSQESKDLLVVSASVAGRFGQAAQEASMFGLPDVRLALEKKDCSLAMSLLAKQEDVLLELRTQGDDIQRQHAELQGSVRGLLALRQRLKPDRRSSAVSEAILLMKMGKHQGSPRSAQTSSTECGSAYHGDQSSDDGCQSVDDEYPHLPLLDCEAGAAETLDSTSNGPCDSDSEASLSIPQELLMNISEGVEANLVFWQDMNKMVQKLTQMKQHASCLVQCANASERLHVRVEQRLGEYSGVWASLDLACQQYVADHIEA